MQAQRKADLRLRWNWLPIRELIITKEMFHVSSRSSRCPLNFVVNMDDGSLGTGWYGFLVNSLVFHPPGSLPMAIYTHSDRVDSPTLILLKIYSNQPLPYRSTSRGRKEVKTHTRVADKYVRQVNCYRGSIIFVSAAALEHLCFCVALRCKFTWPTYVSATWV